MNGSPCSRAVTAACWMKVVVPLVEYCVTIARLGPSEAGWTSQPMRQPVMQ